MEAGQESQLTAQVRLARASGAAGSCAPALSVALALAAGLALRLWMLRNAL